MTKRGKKRSGKKHAGSDAEGDPDYNDQPSKAPRSDPNGSLVDLSFFRSSAQLYGELHHQLSHLDKEGFTETSVLQTGRLVLRVLSDLAEGPRSNSQSSCPFVMLLSMALPTFRKYLAWTQATRSLWTSSSLRMQSASFDGLLYKSDTDSTLWAMVAQYDILTRFSLQAAHILRFVDANEAIDHDGSLPKQDLHTAKQHGSASHASSASSASSSVASTPRERIDSTEVHTPRSTQAQQYAIPQVYRISVEFACLHAEFKVQLAELTECLVEKIDTIAKYMCTPTAAKDAAKISARDYVERLIQHLLEPMGQRMIAEPSIAYTNLFPRLLEQCINVMIDNFARSNGKLNELHAAPFEAGAMHLRTWSVKLEIEYNALVRQLGHNNRRISKVDANEIDVVAASSANNRLDLLSLGGFKRLEITLSSWLTSSTNAGNGPDAGSGSSSRSWGVSNLTGGIRSTLVRTFSGRITFSGSSSRLS